MVPIAQQRVDLPPRPSIERRGRFVEQEQVWISSQGAGHRYPLGLAAGTLVGPTIYQILQVEQCQEGIHPVGG